MYLKPEKGTPFGRSLSVPVGHYRVYTPSDPTVTLKIKDFKSSRQMFAFSLAAAKELLVLEWKLKSHFSVLCSVTYTDYTYSPDIKIPLLILQQQQ